LEVEVGSEMMRAFASDCKAKTIKLGNGYSESFRSVYKLRIPPTPELAEAAFGGDNRTLVKWFGSAPAGPVQLLRDGVQGIGGAQFGRPIVPGGGQGKVGVFALDPEWAEEGNGGGEGTVAIRGQDDGHVVGQLLQLGVFATRSPVRPNGIGLSVAGITNVDVERGEVRLAWIDAEDGSPILDIKPYHPSSDRIESPHMPSWCAHWPRSLEQSASFDWSTLFRQG
jgi:hypothetical protein